MRELGWRGTVIAIIAALLLLALLITALLEGKRFLSRIYVLESQVKRAVVLLQSVETWLSHDQLRVDGFSSASQSEMVAECSRALFVGHIYPKNQYFSPDKPRFPDPEQALDQLIRAVRKGDFQRVIFGGDSVHTPTNSALNHLLELKTKYFPDARFLLGNHDDYWRIARETPERFRGIYGDRHGWEEINGVRLVYLHTVDRDGNYRLDEAERAFLKSALTGDGYHYALVFMHHALWAGDTLWANTRYPNARELAAEWTGELLTALIRGRVHAVFAGDGGWRRPGGQEVWSGIPHFITGWPGRRTDILSEWLNIGLCQDGLVVTRVRVHQGELFRRREWPAQVGTEE